MANRIWHDVRTPGRNKVVIDGRFNPNGVNPVTGVIGIGFTVARTGVGIFTITLEDAYASLESAHATVQLVAAADTYAQFGAYDATLRTLIVRTLTAGVPADIAADTNNRVHFELTMRNTA